MKKTILLTISLTIAIIVIGFSGCDSITSPPASSSRLNNTAGQQAMGIWVTGQGEVTITPDLALLIVGVEAQEDTVANALAKASSAMNDLMTALINSGIEEKDIQTQRFLIDQQTRWDNYNEEEIITGYQVINTVTVKIRDIDNAGSIVDVAVEAGGDSIRIDSFTFTVEDPTEYYDEAREKASEDAKDKAEKLARQNGVRLGEPTFIAESSYSPSGYRSVTYALDSSAIPASVSPGELDVILTVQVAYSIE